MAKYESKIKLVAAPVEAVYAKLSDFENLRPIIENATDNDMVRQKMHEAGQDPSVLDNLRNVELTSDRVAMPAGMLGTLSLVVVEREQNKCIKFQTRQAYGFRFYLHLRSTHTPLTATSCRAQRCASHSRRTSTQ